MLTSQAAYTVLVLLVGVERLTELQRSNRNAKLAFASGGREVGQGHYGVMRVMHAAFLFSCIGEVWLFERPMVLGLAVPMLAVLAGTMALRYWVIATLRERWNTRVIVVPSWQPAVDGPYRWLRHPNYVAVVLELLALPLVHGAILTAVLFGIANAALLTVRLRAEETALAQWPAYETAMRSRRGQILTGTGSRSSSRQ